MPDDKKTALITGSSRGIGLAIAKRLSLEGMNICINYSGSEAAACEAAKECMNDGSKVMAYKADIGNPTEIKDMFQAITFRFGTVDILINNAGIIRDGFLIGLKDIDIEDVLNINLRGAILCAREASKLMLKKRSGRIINISSVTGLHGNAAQCNYAAAKAGLIGFTKSLAKELAAKNITVNAIAPGFIDTDMVRSMPEKAKDGIVDMIPLKRLGQAEDVAHAVAFLAGDDAAYITGQVICIDGGMSM